MITIKTSHGEIAIELFDDKAPITCENFRQSIADGFYQDTIFHRVMPKFMIQGGGMDVSLSGKQTREPIKNEADNGESNDRGTLAMARTGEVDSATAQFFINLRDNDPLNHRGRDFGYAVFARVTDGMNVVDAIAGVETEDRAGLHDVPVESVTILDVTIDA